MANEQIKDYATTPLADTDSLIKQSVTGLTARTTEGGNFLVDENGMANKQIKDYTNLPLADTDSLVKQSVTGLTARTTLADIKGNLDGRYQGKGTIVFDDIDGEINPSVELRDGYYYLVETEGTLTPGGSLCTTQVFFKFSIVPYPLVQSVAFSVVGFTEFGDISFQNCLITALEDSINAGVLETEYELKIYKITEYRGEPI